MRRPTVLPATALVAAGNLQASIRCVGLGRNMQVNLWSYTAPNVANPGEGCRLPHPTRAVPGESAFPYRDLDVFNRSFARDKLYAAAAEANDRKARDALVPVPAPAGGDLWPVEPVC
jgi:hypothetical protein